MSMMRMIVGTRDIHPLRTDEGSNFSEAASQAEQRRTVSKWSLEIARVYISHLALHIGYLANGEGELVQGNFRFLQVTEESKFAF